MTETTFKTINVATPNAPVSIPGYELLEKIGAGGYGEVWRALAPGNVQKAVKFVFGTVDEARGVSELKSLERIKDARHPFLLVLERYDVIDGRLVVVSELAEGSLKDRLDECRMQGKPGIPRVELLEYLRDAADALDFMYEKHGLAHLDIKPENILLVGGRAKVADFGLTKDVTREDHSMMSGLTPQFAAPEVFEGRASRQSDQYSLAIVYQLLLTGESPFNGRTAAQLTAQHLHSTPSLSALPPSDRSTISRALAKKSSQRFDTCREMVEELFNRPSRRRSQEARAEQRPGRTRPIAVAEDVPAQLAARFGQSPPPAVRDRYRPAAESDSTVDPRPTLVIGIGGIGRRVLDGIGASMTATVRSLLLDIDPVAISELKRREDTSAGTAEPALMPLRTSADYRRDSDRWLEWIDRRWLYNVPRSLLTEGIRPLGRLACLDNQDSLRDRIRQHLSQMTAKNGARPLVYVIASSSGGTGSGALIDVADLARQAAAAEGLEIECRAVVVHAKRPNSVNGDLADANSVALLAELRHTAVVRQSEIDAQSESPSGFSQVHLVDAGDSGDEADIEQALRTAMRYLEQALSTRVGPVLDQDAASDRAETPMLGTVGFAPIPGVAPEAIENLVQRMLRDCLEHWSGPLAVERAERLPELARGFLQKRSLSADAMPGLVDTLATEVGERLEPIVAALAGGAAGDPGRRVDLLEECLSVSEDPLSEEDPSYAWFLIRREHQRGNDRLLKEITKSIGQLAECPGPRLASPFAMLEAVRNELGRSQKTVAGIREELNARLEALRGESTGPGPDEDSRWQELLRTRLRLAIATNQLELLASTTSRLAEFGERLSATIRPFRLAGDEARGATGESVPTPLLDELDRRLQAVLEGRGQRFGTLLHIDPNGLHAVLHSTARSLAAESLGSATLRSVGAEGLREFVTRTFGAARPRLPVRGDVRLVLTVPSVALGNKLAPQDRGVDVLVVVDPELEPGVLWVTTGVPYAHVAKRFVGERPTVLQLADRLHTRTDVNWRA